MNRRPSHHRESDAMLDAHAIVLSPFETLVLNLSLLAVVAWSMWKAEKS